MKNGDTDFIGDIAAKIGRLEKGAETAEKELDIYRSAIERLQAESQRTTIILRLITAALAILLVKAFGSDVASVIKLLHP